MHPILFLKYECDNTVRWFTIREKIQLITQASSQSFVSLVWKSFTMWISSLASVLCSLDGFVLSEDFFFGITCRCTYTHACTHTNLNGYMHKHIAYPYEQLWKIKPIILRLTKSQWALHRRQQVPITERLLSLNSRINLEKYKHLRHVEDLTLNG